MKTVTIVGTGTIGLPLAGILARNASDFGIDRVIVFKNTPLVHDISHIKQLLKHNVMLATDKDKFLKFHALGIMPMFTREEAILEADVVIDCTPQASNGRHLYDQLGKPGQLFLAQGNAKEWGKPYAWGANEKALQDTDSFIKIVSCNTHSLVRLTSLIKSVAELRYANFLCIRRANDISQDSKMVPSIEVGKGTSHHAQDALEVFETIDKPNFSLYSSACKINSQYMHAIHFAGLVEDYAVFESEDCVRDFFVERIKQDERVALTHKTTTNKVFSFGRDFGYYGRILSQTVVVEPSISVKEVMPDHYEISGFAFTPQDGNSLISSVAATLWKIHDHDWYETRKRMDCLNSFLFQEI